MSYELKYNAELQLMELQFTGEMTFKDIQDAAAALARMTKETGSVLLLNDCRQATIRMSTVEIYEVPNALRDILAANGVDIFSIRRALVAQDDLENFGFFETVAVNRGQRVKLFTDIDEARRWLLGPAAESPSPS